MQSLPKRHLNLSIIVVFCVLPFIFIGVIVRLIWLQAITPKTKGRPNWQLEVPKLALRGSIYDCKSRILAQSIPGYIAFIDALDPRIELGPGSPAEKNRPPYDRNLLAQETAAITGCDFQTIRKAYDRKVRYTPFGILTDEKTIRALKERILPSQHVLAGVGMDIKEVRHYFSENRLKRVLGFVNAEGVGFYGIEQRYNKYLLGANGYTQTRTDARRKEIRPYRTEELPPLPGADIHLTIDSTIQDICTDALLEGGALHNATSGFAVVQDVHTGEIIAAATAPEFNPDQFKPRAKDSPSLKEIGNPIVNLNFEPGSVMKPIPIAMALKLGVINKNYTTDVGKGMWYYAGRPLRDHVYGEIGLETIIAKSSNIGTAKIGLLLAEPDPQAGFNEPNKRLDLALRAFGFGRLTQVDIPGEERGIFPQVKSWSMLTPTRIVIGQGIAVTPIQLVCAYSALANGGKLMKPYLMKRIVSTDGTVLLENSPTVVGRPISPEISLQVTQWMSQTTTRNGTARRAATKSYTVAGKTGTAQIPTKGGYSHTDYYGSFCGVFPASNPRFTILVTLERPHPIHVGGVVAAPIFAKIAESIGNYLAIPADKPTKEE